MYFEDVILWAFVITVFTETFVILIIQRPKEWVQWLITIVCLNALTHPPTLYLLHIENAPYIAVEGAVWLLEAAGLKYLFDLTWRRSLILSGVANLASFLAGMAVRLFI